MGGEVPQAQCSPDIVDHVTRDDFDMLTVLGRGSYGNVLQACKRDSGRLYAVKVMAKKDVVDRKQVQHTLTEKALLEAVRHPFIIRLHFAFQSAASLYLVMELQSGGELFFHLRRDGAFSESRVRLYAAEILLALAALHDHHFVYRDLKPENLLLDASGHVSLSDFGLAKGGVRELNRGASTFCGTPSYMAPELLLGAGHGLAVDWWCFGTFVYEALSGAPPFYSRSLHTMYRGILSGGVPWSRSISHHARPMLEGLLCRDPLRRLGARGPSQLRKQRFFKGLDFKRVLRRGYTPDFTPALAGASDSARAMDTTNFDVAFTAESPADLLDEANDGSAAAPQSQSGDARGSSTAAATDSADAHGHGDVAKGKVHSASGCQDRVEGVDENADSEAAEQRESSLRHLSQTWQPYSSSSRS